MSTRPMRIYMGVGVSLMRFKYPAIQKTLLQMLWFKLPFPKLPFRINYKVLHIQKVKVKTFIAVVSFLLYFLLLLLFFFISLNIFFRSLVISSISIFYLAYIFLMIFFSFLKNQKPWKTLKKAMMDNFFDFVSRDSFNECLENDARKCIFLLWLWIIDTTKENTGFYDNAYFLDLSRVDVYIT